MTKRIVHHQLPFTNDYVFSKVMRNPEYCKEILTRILPDKKVKKVKVLNDILEEESSGAGSFETGSPGTESGQQVDTQIASTQANIKTAKKMKSRGYETKEISELTGLTVEEIERL